jgi:hypothetical protein
VVPEITIVVKTAEVDETERVKTVGTERVLKVDDETM